MHVSYNGYAYYAAQISTIIMTYLKYSIFECDLTCVLYYHTTNPHDIACNIMQPDLDFEHVHINKIVRVYRKM